MAKLILTIDRVVLDGMGIPPEHVGRLGPLLEKELARVLGAPGGLEALEGGEVDYLRGSAIAPALPPGDHQLATDLARSLASAINGLATSGGKGNSHA